MCFTVNVTGGGVALKGGRGFNAGAAGLFDKLCLTESLLKTNLAQHSFN